MHAFCYDMNHVFLYNIFREGDGGKIQVCSWEQNQHSLKTFFYKAHCLKKSSIALGDYFAHSMLLLFEFPPTMITDIVIR